MIVISHTISSKEDRSSVDYGGRAFSQFLLENSRMKNIKWRERLLKALEESGKSKRAVSLSSGNGPGYLHSILKDGKDPTIENLLSICDALGVSPIYVLYGFDVGREETELLVALKDNPSKRRAILSLLRDEADQTL